MTSHQEQAEQLVQTKAGWFAVTSLVGGILFGCVIFALAWWRWQTIPSHAVGWERAAEYLFVCLLAAIGFGLAAVCIWGWRIKSWHEHTIVRARAASLGEQTRTTD